MYSSYTSVNFYLLCSKNELTINIITVTTIRTVDIAEIAGLISNLKLLKIILGKVIVVRSVIKSEITDSSKEVTKEKRILVNNAGFTNGKITRMFASM